MTTGDVALEIDNMRLLPQHNRYSEKFIHIPKIDRIPYNNTIIARTIDYHRLVQILLSISLNKI